MLMAAEATILAIACSAMAGGAGGVMITIKPEIALMIEIDALPAAHIVATRAARRNAIMQACGRNLMAGFALIAN